MDKCGVLLNIYNLSVASLTMVSSIIDLYSLSSFESVMVSRLIIYESMMSKYELILKG